MEREEIIRRAKKLPATHPEKIADDHEIWEGNEKGAHFKFSRHYLPQAPFIKFYVLSVSGNEEGRESVISDFKSTLGEPQEQGTYPEIPGVYFVSWDAGKAKLDS